jgi:hypothetical protein
MPLPVPDRDHSATIHATLQIVGFRSFGQTKARAGLGFLYRVESNPYRRFEAARDRIMLD